MNVLVTGVSGFIGSNLASYLVKEGYYMIGTYNSRVPKNAVNKVIPCNLAAEDLKRTFDGVQIDAVIHLAGQMTGNYICDYLDNTVNASRKLIQYAQEQGIPKFIYISSIAAYGETNCEVDENSDRTNLDDYGTTKYICERMLEDSNILSRIVIRQPRTLGKKCDLSYPWLPKTADKMLHNETVYYMNPDLMYNNLLYADDFSDFIQKLLDKEMEGFYRFVLGAKDKMKVLNILQCMKNNLGSSSQLIEREPTGRNTCYAIDTSYAERYGFQSRSSEEIIMQFCKDILWEKENA